jgi:hypothetical protein
MSYLAVKVTEYLQRSPVTARQLEDNAGLPRMTIGTIVKDGHPRPDRFGQLLKAVDDQTARDWLEAYLLDDCPEAWLPRVKILIEGLHHIQTAEGLAEPTATYAAPIDPIAATQRALHRLQTAMARDTELSTWFIQTIALILGPGDDS